MFDRRDFLTLAASLTALGTMSGAPTLARPHRPLRARHRPLRLRLHADQSGRLVIASDAFPAPRPLIRAEVIDAVFGAGTNDALTQPDHWRMIEADMFAPEMLYTPGAHDPAFYAWHAYHKPTSEAFEALTGLFEEGTGSSCGWHVPAFQLSFVEHPCSPRFALAILHDPAGINRLAEAIRSRDDGIVLDPTPSTELVL